MEKIQKETKSWSLAFEVLVLAIMIVAGFGYILWFTGDTARMYIEKYTEEHRGNSYINHSK